jgi:hypothetical protein
MDKVQKIREEIERVKTVHSSVSLKDSKPDILAVQICSNLLSFIDSLQEEPVAPDVLEDMLNAKTAAESLGISLS